MNMETLLISCLITGIMQKFIKNWNNCLENIAYIRIVAVNIDTKSILTVNEEVPV